MEWAPGAPHSQAENPPSHPPVSSDGGRFGAHTGLRLHPWNFHPPVRPLPPEAKSLCDPHDSPGGTSSAGEATTAQRPREPRGSTPSGSPSPRPDPAGVGDESPAPAGVRTSSRSNSAPWTPFEATMNGRLCLKSPLLVFFPLCSCPPHSCPPFLLGASPLQAPARKQPVTKMESVTSTGPGVGHHAQSSVSGGSRPGLLRTDRGPRFNPGVQGAQEVC